MEGQNPLFTFGDSLNSHVHFHVIVTDGVFSADPDNPDKVVFHLATELDEAVIRIVRDQLRHRGLRRLVRPLDLLTPVPSQNPIRAEMGVILARSPGPLERALALDL